MPTCFGSAASAVPATATTPTIASAIVQADMRMPKERPIGATVGPRLAGVMSSRHSAARGAATHPGRCVWLDIEGGPGPRLRSRAMQGPWPLVGRDEELRYIADVAARPGPGCIVLAGSAGCGKTRL